jgi:uncharacterized membrane protein
MEMNMLATRISLATAAAVVAVTGAAVTQAAAKADEKLVHCYGINTCKGSSDCATANSACKGQNACKGQGFKALTVKACKAAGGRLTEK